MPEIEVAFIDPKAALGKLAIQAKAAKAADEDLGPSGPHQFDEPQKAKLQVKVAAQPVAMSPGLPPLVGEAHYTEVLDEIWPEFDDPEERTAARLSSLLEEVADEAQRVHLLAQDVWEKLPFYKVQDSERKRYDAEFLAYLRRLNVYRKALDELDDDSTATADVYVGLVQRKHQAGPVPDCIMHMYFAQQLGILQDHADDMGEGFVGRVMDGLGAVSEVVESQMVTRGVHESATADALRQSCLWGLAGVIGAEQPQLWGGLIDLPFGADQRLPDIANT